MSLINKMLRDLDARHAPNVDRSALPGTLHALPAAPAAAPWAKVAGGTVLVAAALGAYWMTLRSGPAVQPLQVAVVPGLPKPVVVEAPPPALTAIVPPPAAVAEPEKPALPPAAAVVAVAAPAKANAPAKAATAKPRAEPAAAVRPESKLSGAQERMPAVIPPPPAALVDAGPSAIDKRPRTAPANEAAETEYRKAMAAVRRGATSEAVDGLRTALNLEKKHVSARQALLSVLVEQRQWTEAQALIEEGLALDPAQAGWAMALARLQLEHGKLAEAVETLARHAPYAEQHADYLAFHGLLLQRQKRHGDAAQRYRAALALRPTESRWWYGLGLALESEQKAPEARAAFLRAKETGNLPQELSAVIEQRLR